jgi:predicted phosphodiesterase
MIFGDLHFGSKDLNYENFLEKFLTNFKIILNDVIASTRIDRILFINLGDDIENIIHLSQLENSLPLEVGLKQLKRFFKEVFNILLPEEMIVVKGNHDRITKHYPTIHYHTTEIYEFLSEIYKIPIRIVDSIKIKEKGWNIFIKHDIGIRTLSGEVSGLALQRAMNKIRALYDRYDNEGKIEKTEIVISGHLHKMLIYSLSDGIIILNGTSHRKSFHLNNLKAEDVGQFMLLLPEKTKCLNPNNQLNFTIGKIIPIWCE